MLQLDSAFSCKGLNLKNRVVMAPMCQYSVDTEDGKPNDWHYIHYVSRAVGGTGLIIMEVGAVDPEGRISNRDLGIWSDTHITDYQRIVSEIHKNGAKVGIQIGHAGRKAENAIQPVGASDIPVGVPNDGKSKGPRALTTEEVKVVINQFREATRRAVEAGFDTVELHGAHGYLLHQFHSPGINNRKDEYGQDLSRFGVEVIKAMKSVMPEEMPLIMRISAIEYMDGGYKLEHSLDLAKHYKVAGVDIFHISSGGEAAPGVLKPGNYPGYQINFARAYKQELKVPIIAVGKLEDAQLAQATIANNDADLIAVGRGMLNDPYWALHAINAVTGNVEPPVQYERGIMSLRKG